MIIGFASKETEKIWRGEVSRKLPRDIQQIALRKLFMLDKAQTLNDLKIPPANRLEALKDDHTHQRPVANLFCVDEERPQCCRDR
jgi:proteic killer suppression protein